MNWYIKIASTRTLEQLPTASFAKASGEAIPNHKVLIVGQDIQNFFLHATKKRTHKTIGGERPDNNPKGKPNAWGLGGEENPHNADLYICEPSNPGQALSFAQREGFGLFVVTLKDGSKFIDMSEDMHGFFAPQPLKPYHPKQQPAITNDLSQWVLDQRSKGDPQKAEKYKQRTFDAFSVQPEKYNPYAWRQYLIPFAKQQGYAGLRFEDEIMLTSQSFVQSIRPLKKQEYLSLGLDRNEKGNV